MPQAGLAVLVAHKVPVAALVSAWAELVVVYTPEPVVVYTLALTVYTLEPEPVVAWEVYTSVQAVSVVSAVYTSVVLRPVLSLQRPTSHILGRKQHHL